jgi:hypothetical protein
MLLSFKSQIFHKVEKETRAKLICLPIWRHNSLALHFPLSIKKMSSNLPFFVSWNVRIDNPNEYNKYINQGIPPSAARNNQLAISCGSHNMICLLVGAGGGVRRVAAADERVRSSSSNQWRKRDYQIELTIERETSHVVCGRVSGQQRRKNRPI